MALQKYDPAVLCCGGDAEMAPSPSGEYVRLEEVIEEAEKYALALESAGQSMAAIPLRELKRRLSDTAEAAEHLVIDREGEIARYHPEPTKGEED